MRTRHIEMLRIMLNNKLVDMTKLMNIYDISKRTLFYDLEELNHELGSIGKLRVENDVVILDGELDAIDHHVSKRVFEPFYERRERQDRILLSILENERKTLDDFVSIFNVSKTTIFSDIETIRSTMYQDGITLEYNKQYYLKGTEYIIRDMYLRLLVLKEFDFSYIPKSIIDFNLNNNLYLSDYSLFYLSCFLSFIEKRNDSPIKKSGWLKQTDLYLVDEVNFDVSEIMNIDDKDEIQYLKAYVLSLSTNGHKDVSKVVHLFVKEFLKEVKNRMALDVNWDLAFTANLENHLIASFYRIKFGFPALNPNLNDIRVKYFYLFLNIKNIIRSIDHISVFHKMRDEEIGFVVAYIGGYLYEISDMNKTSQHRVILVCPQGRAVAHHLRVQIEKAFPNIDIIGTYSINQLGSIVENYDTIITTLELPYFQNVIKVQPILSENDKLRLLNQFGNVSIEVRDIEFELLEIIEKYTTIHNKKDLEKEINKVLEVNKKIRRYQPMLHELITKDRIQVVDAVSNWKEAINLASKPLLEQGVFGEDYVESMIGGIEKYGPYIVLADEFALPHASNQGSVKEVAISVLVVKEKVDLLGKPVKVFMVLATIDNESHLKALVSLTDIISDNDNLELIKKGNVDEIYEILGGGVK